MMDPIAAWLVALMLSLSPPHESRIPGWQETAQQRAQRYVSIAEDVHSVVFSSDQSPLFDDPLGRHRTAALVVALAFKESGFDPDVDRGPCYRGKKGGPYWAKCDYGRSACMLQIHIGTGKTQEGWRKRDLFADRKKCLIEAMRRLRLSFQACTRMGSDAALNVYASGACRRGQRAGKDRLSLGRWLFTRSPPPGALMR